MRGRGWSVHPEFSIPVAPVSPSQPAMPPSTRAIDQHVAHLAGAFSPGGHYACPVESCDVAWDVPEITVTSALDASGRHTAVYTGVQNVEVEREVRAHLEGHDVEDWLFTVQHIRVDVADLEDQCRVLVGERDHAVEALRRLTNAVQAKVARSTWPGPA